MSLFEKELAKDIELRTMAVQIAKMTKAMNDVQIWKDRPVLDSIRSVDETSMKRCITGQKRHIIWRNATSIAACILFLLSITYFIELYIQQESLYHIADQQVKTFVTSGISHGEEDEIEKELNTLYNNVILKKDIHNTIERLKILYEVSILKEDNSYSEHSFLIGWYLTSAYLYDKNVTKAKEILQRMKNHGFEKTIQTQKVDSLLKQLSEY